MIELVVSLCVGAIVVLIYKRYRSVFCLPFFWAAYFLFQYLGFLEIHTKHGGTSYAYAAAAFGTFYAGLLIADFFIFFHARSRKRNPERRRGKDSPEEPAPKPGWQSAPTRIRLLFPSLALNIGLFVALIAATFVTIVFFANQGFPILSSFPALAWVESTSGVVNRLMTVFGTGAYAGLGLAAWAIHRETGSPAALAMMYLGLGLAIFGEALLASKAAAILIFIWFNILLFYMNKKREFRKSLLPLLLVVVPVSFMIVAVRLISIQGYWNATSVFKTYYVRVTSEQAAPADFIFKYSNRFGPLHGRGLHREMERVKDQLTGSPKTAIPSEYIYDLMDGMPTTATGLSAALTLYGTGYLEWGIAGMLLYSLLQGLGFGFFHRYLLRQESMNLITLLFWGGILNYLMFASGAGTVLVSLESVFLDAVPPLILLLPFGALFHLPIARKYRTSAGTRIGGAPRKIATLGSAREGR